MSAPNVMCQAHQSSEVGPRPARPTGSRYRTAVAQVIRSVKASERLSNERLAEEIGCSESTVYNAENENGDLAAVTLLNIAFQYGEDAIEPVRALYRCAPAAPPSRADRFRKLRAELDALEKGEVE